MVSREQGEQSTKFGTFIEHSEKLDQSAQTKNALLVVWFLGRLMKLGWLEVVSHCHEVAGGGDCF